MARRTVLVCDKCGKEVGENKGAALRVTYTDARRGSKVADLCDDCAGKMPGRLPPAAAGGRARPRRRRVSRSERRFRPLERAQGTVLGQAYHGPWG